jgi:hypothetical protein
MTIEMTAWIFATIHPCCFNGRRYRAYWQEDVVNCIVFGCYLLGSWWETEKLHLYLDWLDQPLFSICDPINIMLYHLLAVSISVCLQISNTVIVTFMCSAKV